eukprot:scaffold7092_cov262-Pinguiococcus_pyrenoidosus.AAC.11
MLRATPATRSLLLKFATGASAPPMGGFRSLGLSSARGGRDNAAPFTIVRFDREVAGGTAKLPTAATCFNMLRIPAYESFRELEERLMTAVRHGCEGFTKGLQNVCGLGAARILFQRTWHATGTATDCVVPLALREARAEGTAGNSLWSCPEETSAPRSRLCSSDGRG